MTAIRSYAAWRRSQPKRHVVPEACACGKPIALRCEDCTSALCASHYVTVRVGRGWVNLCDRCRRDRQQTGAA